MEDIAVKKKEKFLLSIIIPVYNVEKYIDQCLNSVLNCDLKDCEVLLSLGKSKDNSNFICETYKDKNSIIKIVYQNGTGLSNARNCALKIAQGKYIVFIDSDDFVNSIYLDKIINLLRNDSFKQDVIVTDFSRYNRKTGKVHSVFQIGENKEIYYGMEFIPHMLRKKQCFWTVWRYIYRKSFLVKNNISFCENRCCEDIDYTTRVLIANPMIAFWHCPFYVYTVKRGDSLMDKLNLKRLTDTVFIITDSIQRLRESNFRYADLVIAQYQYEYLLNMAQVVEVDSKDYVRAIQLYSNHKFVLSESKDRLINLAKLCISFLGIKRVSAVLYSLKRLKRMINT